MKISIGPFSILCVVAAVLAVLRFYQTPSPLSLAVTYQAVAHLFVAGVFGYALGTRKWLYMLIVMALSAVELTAFILHH